MLRTLPNVDAHSMPMVFFFFIFYAMLLLVIRFIRVILYIYVTSGNH